MKKWLIDELICPECLDLEVHLSVHVHKETGDDIIEGHLACPECDRRYDIRDGIAVVVPEKTLHVTLSKKGYNSFSVLSSYLWSQYSEFFSEKDSTTAYRKWADCFIPQDGWALDIGCSVGRLAFEMTKTHDRAVGVDTSLTFIRSARTIASQGHVQFNMVMEGRIARRQSCMLDTGFECDNAEFIVADAMALPFRSGRFVTTSSVNILEKVPDPSLHLSEANRVIDADHGRFLFSDPFSWDEDTSHPDLWLGGRNKGPFRGFGIENICRMLEDPNGIFSPGFSICEKGEVFWKIRKTRNLWEHITSQFVMAERAKEALY